MTAPKVRADYDGLRSVAIQFGGLAQDARQTIQALKGHLDTLRAGDWVGPGAVAFYAEMDGQVMPALLRLASAFDLAEQSANQISQLVRNAEADASRVLRGSGAAVMPAPADGAGGASPAEMVDIATTIVEAMRAVGGSDLAALASEAVLAGLKSGGAPTAVIDAVAMALESASVDRMLAALDPSVRDMVKLSPTLRSQMLSLERDGWKVVTGPAGGGSSTNSSETTITIAAPRADEAVVRSVAHEAGHARGNRPASIAVTDAMTREEYVRLSVDNDMLGEGDATFNNAVVREEIIAAGGADIGISGTQTAAYQQVYEDFKAGSITQEQAVERMGTLVGNERTSIPPKPRYRDYYGDGHRAHWDAEIAPTRELR